MQVKPWQDKTSFLAGVSDSALSRLFAMKMAQRGKPPHNQDLSAPRYSRSFSAPLSNVNTIIKQLERLHTSGLYESEHRRRSGCPRFYLRNLNGRVLRQAQFYLRAEHVTPCRAPMISGASAVADSALRLFETLTGAQNFLKTRTKGALRPGRDQPTTSAIRHISMS
jgi:hypothetical protein